MSHSNSELYATPESNLSTTEEAYNQAGMFNISARIGRVRYLAYGAAYMALSFIFSFVVMMIFMIVAMLLDGGDLNMTKLSSGNSVYLYVVIGITIVFIYIVPIVCGFIVAVRRLHDFGCSGFWSLLFLLPLINIILLFILVLKSGEEGVNKYGAPAEPNSWWVHLMAVLSILVMSTMVIIIISSAIESYDKYSNLAESRQLNN